MHRPPSGIDSGQGKMKSEKSESDKAEMGAGENPKQGKRTQAGMGRSGGAGEREGGGEK